MFGGQAAVKTPSSPYGAPLPRVVHATASVNALKKNVVIVGDVHGCLDELKELVELVKQKTKDEATFVFVGDLVNKGPYSSEVVQFVRSLPGAFCVRGNHDESVLAHALRYQKGLGLPKSKNGFSYDYIAKLSNEDINWLQELPFTLALPSLNSLVVHAGLVPRLPLEQQSLFDAIMIRNVVDGKGSASGSQGEAWAPMWPSSSSSSPHIYFGHDAKRGLQQCAGATGLDTGCCYGKQLTAVILSRQNGDASCVLNKELVQVQAKRAYEEIPSTVTAT